MINHYMASLFEMQVFTTYMYKLPYFGHNYEQKKVSDTDLREIESLSSLP